MQKLSFGLLFVLLIVVLLKFGPRIQAFFNTEASTQLQVETWNKRIAETEEPNQVEDTCDYTMRFHFSDTLLHNRKEFFVDTFHYNASFDFPIFSGGDSKTIFLNKAIGALVFDEFKGPGAYVDHYLQEYLETFADQPAEETYYWGDLEKIELKINSSRLVSFIHWDFANKSGGAIWFGEMLGYNYDLRQEKEISFSDLIDTTKMELLKDILMESYKKQFSISSLQEHNWNNEVIPINQNICLTEDGILFLYQRFEFDRIGPLGLQLLVPYCSIEGVLRDGIWKEQLNSMEDF